MRGRERGQECYFNGKPSKWKHEAKVMELPVTVFMKIFLCYQLDIMLIIRI